MALHACVVYSLKRPKTLSSVLGGSCPYQELADSAGKEASVTHIAFSPDAQYVVLCRGSQALVYSTKVGVD